MFLLSLNSFTLCRRNAAASSNLGYILHLCICIYTYLPVYMHHVYLGDCGGCKEGIQTFGTDDKKGLQASQCRPWELNQVLQQAQRVLLSTGSFTPAVPDDSSLGISQSLWLPSRHSPCPSVLCFAASADAHSASIWALPETSTFILDF